MMRKWVYACMQSAGWPFPKQTLAEFNLNTTEGRRSADSITYLLRAAAYARESLGE